MADDFSTSPPTSGGATFRAYDDGTRLWPAGVVAYLETEADPDVPRAVLPSRGLPVVQQTGSTFAVSLAATSNFNLASYGGSAVGAGNALHIQPGTGATFAVTGTFWQATQPVSIATVPSHDVTNTGTFAVQVTSLPAITATNLDIRDLTKASDSVAVWSNTAKDGSGTAYQPLLDTDGHAQVDVLSSALPSGASTAALQTTGNTALAAIQTAVELLDNAVAGNELQVDVLTMPTVMVQATNLDIRDLTSASDSVAAVQSGTWTVQPGNTANTTPWLVGVGTNCTGNSGGLITWLNVGVVDSSGNQISNFARAYNEDAESAGGEYLTLAGFVRQDTPSSSVTTDGDYATGKVDSVGRLWVNASGAAVPVTDNSGSLTVDNNGTFAVQAAQSGTWNITNISGTVSLPTGAATAANQSTANTALAAIQTATELIDDAITTLGTSTYTEATSKGITIGAVRRDADTTLVNTTNEFGPLQMDANGRLKVEVFSGETLPVSLTSTAVTNAGTFVVQENGAALTALQLIDNAVSATGTAAGTTDGGYNCLAVRRDTAAVAATVADGDYTPLAVDSTGRLWCNVSNTVTVASHAVTNAGTFAVQVDGSALTALQLIDDPVATLGTTTYSEATTKGFIIGAVRRDADTTLVDTTNEVAPLQVDANGRLKVEVFSGETLPVSLASVAVTNAGTFVVQENGAALTALQLIDDVIFQDDTAFTPGTSKVAVVGFQADESSTDSVDEGDAGAARMTLDRKVIVTTQPHTTGGLSMSHLVSAAGTNATVVKASAGKLYGIQIGNASGARQWVKLHNTSSAPTAGTTAVVKAIQVENAGVTHLNFGDGLEFSTGIAFTTVTTAADSGSTGSGTGLTVECDYK